jgi:hypothetical protein
LSVKLAPDAFKKIKKVNVGFLPHKIDKEQNAIHVNFGALRYGQDLEILFEFDSQIDDHKQEFASAEITYETNGDLKFQKFEKIAVSDMSE